MVVRDKDIVENWAWAKLYDWFGVDKAELAVMCELMLRGAQTLGDLRARAARMEKISGLDELKPIVQGLIEKDLMVEITAAGRGQIVSHNVYQAEELDKVFRIHREGGGAPAPAPVAAAAQPATATASAEPDKVARLESEIERLWEKVNSLQSQLDQLLN